MVLILKFGFHTHLTKKSAKTRGVNNIVSSIGQLVLKFLVYSKMAAGGHFEIDVDQESNGHNRFIRARIARNDTSLVILAHFVPNMINFIPCENGSRPPSWIS